MAEKEVFIHCGALALEGLLENLPGGKGVVVTHPHPLYGGDMYNNVVETICRTYREGGYSTLRFNFRGVGKSQGAYEEGRGEQSDVLAALEFLSGQGKTSIDLAGYSFGAWVIAAGIKRFPQARRVVMISPPVNFVGFDFLKDEAKLQLVIVGDRDEIAPHRTVERLIPVWNARATLKVLKGADHFYWGHTEELKAIIGEFLEQE